MFRLFLDPSPSYSSALFGSLRTPPVLADLEAAQLRKVDSILDSAGVEEGSTILEVRTGLGQPGGHASNIKPMGLHYAHTLRLWCAQLVAHWQQVEELGFDDPFLGAQVRLER